MQSTVSFVLLLAILQAVFVVSQSPATEFPGFLQRTLAVSESLTTDHRLPPCYTVDYSITGQQSFYAQSGNTIKANLYTLEFIVKTDQLAPVSANTQPITLQLLSGTDKKTVIVPTSTVNTATINGTQYVGNPTCSFNAATGLITRNAGAVGQTCAVEFFCSGLKKLTSNVMTLRITSASNEDANGVFYDLRFRERLVDVAVINADTIVQTTPVVTPPGELFLWRPTFAQLHYFVSVAPDQSSIASIANYVARASALVNLQFLVNDFRKNATRVTFTAPNAGTWSLTVKNGDLAVADRAQAGQASTPNTGCRDNIDIENNVVTSSQMLVSLTACGSVREFFMSVGFSTTVTNIPFSFNISASFAASTNQFIPVFTTITNNNIFNGVLGNKVLPAQLATVPAQEKYYFLNFPAQNINLNNTYLFVTVFGVAHGNISAQLTENCLGFSSACGGCTVLDQCVEINPAAAANLVDGRDYCKLKIPECSYKVNGTNTYFLSVRAQSDNSNAPKIATEFAVQANLITRTVKDIAQLTKEESLDKSVITWTDVTSVSEQDYNHYKFSLTSAEITKQYHFTAQIYTNHEDEEVIFYYKKDRLAGSRQVFFDTKRDPSDTCFQADRVCATQKKAGGSVNSTNSCMFIFQFCDLVPGGDYYFSVYGLDTSTDHSNLKEEGYNRGVDYTAIFTLRKTAEKLVSGVTTTHTVPARLGLTSATHQFEFRATSILNTFNSVDRVRVRLSNVRTAPGCNGQLSLFIGCAQEAGDCPCFSATVPPCNVNAGGSFCDVQIDLCKCATQKYYISVKSAASTTYCTKHTQFALTPYLDSVFLTSFIGDDELSLTRSNVKVITNRLVFDPQDAEVFLGNRFQSHAHRFTYDGSSDTDALRVTVKYVHHVAQLAPQTVELLVSKNAVAPTNDIGTGVLPTSCAQKCTASQTVGSWSYCTIMVKPCNFTKGEYFFRVVGLDTNLGNANQERNIDYTLELQKIDFKEQTLKLNEPVAQLLGYDEYQHYEVTPPTGESWLRVTVYVNADPMDRVFVYHNVKLLAGTAPCYNFTRRCSINNTIESCDFFFPACKTSTDKLFFSLNQGTNQYRADRKLEYTIVATTGAPIALDDGFPRTGHLVFGEEAYYTFKTPANTNNIFHLQVQSIQPVPNTVASILTTVSTSKPSGDDSLTDGCLCSAIRRIDHFSSVNYGCNFNAVVGTTYYVTVHALKSGTLSPYDPISFTIRAWTTPVPTNTLTVTTNEPALTQIPIAPASGYTLSPVLDYDEWVEYTVAITAGTDVVHYIDIADLTHNAAPINTNTQPGITAWLNIDNSGFPASTTNIFGNNAACSKQSCTVTNNGAAAPANNTVMCRFVIEPCSACSGTYRVTVRSNNLAPEPQPNDRHRFRIRAYSRPINILPFSPFNISAAAFTNTTTVAATQTFTYPSIAAGSPFVECYNTFGSVVRTDFYWKTPLVTYATGYERMTVDPSDANAQVWVVTGTTAVGLGSPISCTAAHPLVRTCLSGTDTFYIREQKTTCTNPGVQALAARTVGFVQVTNKSYKEVGATITVTQQNNNVTAKVQVGEYRHILVDFSTFTLDRVSELDLQVTFPNATAGSLASNTCIRRGTVGVTHPGVTLNTDTYCPVVCTPVAGASLKFDTCCITSADKYIITVYGAHGGAPAEIVVRVAQVFKTVGTPTAASKDTTSGAVPANQYKFFTFSVEVPAFDDGSVYNLVVNPTTATNGSTIFFVRKGGLAGLPGDSTCFNNAFQLTCGQNTTNCAMQIPNCVLSSAAQYGSGTYYIGLKAATANAALLSTAVSFFKETPTDITFPAGTGSGTVPDAKFIAGQAINYYKHYRFRIARADNEQVGLADENQRIRVVLTRTSATNTNRLAMYLHRATTGATVLAGNASPFPAVVSGGCNPSNDNAAGQWVCRDAASPTNVNGTVVIANHLISATAGVSLACELAYCNANADNVNAVNTGTGPTNYIYVSVINTTPAAQLVSTAFSLALSVAKTDSPATTLVQTLTAERNDAATSDVAPTAVCGATNTGGCAVTNVTNTLQKYYFKVDVPVSSLKPLEYLLINITGVSNPITATTFLTNNCEPAAGGTACTNANPCVFETDPCTYTSLFQSDKGDNNGGFTGDSVDLYVRIVPQAGGTFAINSNFVITARVVKPFVETVSNLLTLPIATGFQKTYMMWERRYAMFNFILPNTRDYQLTVNVQSQCTTGNINIWRNKDVYKWPSGGAGCFENANPGAANNFAETLQPCELTGGNYFLAINGPPGAVQFKGIPTNITSEGVISSQIRFTVSAKLTKIQHTEIALECEYPQVAPQATTDYNYVAYADGENFGTQLVFGIKGCAGNQQCDLIVQTPLYRQTFNTDANTGAFFEDAEAEWNTEFYGNNGAPCFVHPVGGNNGRYTCTAANTGATSCTVAIPACSFRSGRFFIRVRTTSSAFTLFSRFDRKDYQVTALDAANKYTVRYFGQLRWTHSQFGTGNSGFYQYYKVTTEPKETSQLVIQLSSSDPNVKQRRLAVAVRRAETGISTASESNNPTCTTTGANTVGYACSQCVTAGLSCSFQLNQAGASCTVQETNCDSDSYYIAVYTTGGAGLVTADTCRTVRYQLDVTGRGPNFKTIKPSTVCGQLKGLQYQDVFTEGKTIPNIIYYKIDTTGVNLAFASVTITATVHRSTGTNDRNLIVSYNNRPASNTCSHANCRSATTNANAVATVGPFSCNLGNLWVSVETSLATTRLIDYSLTVQITEYKSQSISLSGDAQTNATLTDNTVFEFDNTAGTTAISRASITPGTLHRPDVANPAVNPSCSNCAALTQCLWYAEPLKYSIRANKPALVVPTCKSEQVVNVAVPIQFASQKVTLVSDDTFSGDVVNGKFVFYKKVFTEAEFRASSGFTIALESNEGGDIDVHVGCGNIALSNACPFFLKTITLSAQTSVSTNWACANQTCKNMYLAVAGKNTGITCAGPTAAGISSKFSISLRTNQPGPTPDATQVTSVTSDTVVAGTIARYANPTTHTVWYDIKSTTTDGFVHFGVGKVNNTAGNLIHGITVTLFKEGQCQVATCTTGTKPLINPARQNPESESCYVHAIADDVSATDTTATEQTFTARVQIATTAPVTTFNPLASGVHYLLYPIAKFSPLSSTAETHQIQGNARHYYKIDGRVGGTATGALQAVSIELEVLDGPRLLLEWSDSRKFRSLIDNNQYYQKWHQSKVCFFGTCTLSIPTLAAHPGAAVIYVWVSPLSPEHDNRQNNYEKPTNYKITGHKGSETCVSFSSVSSANDFCTGNMGTETGSVWRPQRPQLRHLEAQHRFNTLRNCRCPAATKDCNDTLKKFSCLESFRTCDTNGFWVPKCRGECLFLENKCGLLSNSNPQCTCDDIRTEFSCFSNRYSDAEPCAGSVATPTPTPTPAPVEFGTLKNIVEFEIDFTGRSGKPVANANVVSKKKRDLNAVEDAKDAKASELIILCDEPGLKQTLVDILGVPATSIDILGIRAARACVRVKGIPNGESATSIALRLFNILNEKVPATKGTCLEEASMNIFPDNQSCLRTTDTPEPPPPGSPGGPPPPGSPSNAPPGSPGGPPPPSPSPSPNSGGNSGNSGISFTVKTVSGDSGSSASTLQFSIFATLFTVVLSFFFL